MKKEKKKPTMMTRDDVISILERELPKLKEEYGVQRIVLYGSFAKGTQKKKSDIDILVDIKKPIGLEFISLANRLEEILGHRVEVATYAHFRRSFQNPRYKNIAKDIKKSMIYV